MSLVGVSESTKIEMESDEHILHKVFWFAVQEAVLLLESLDTVEEGETDESPIDS